MDMRDDMDDGDDDEPSGGIHGRAAGIRHGDPQPYLPREAQFYPGQRSAGSARTADLALARWQIRRPAPAPKQ